MLGHILSHIDLLGIPILLNFSKSKKFRSSFGGFWSLAFLAFVIWAIYNSGSELFDKQKPQVNEGVIYNPKIRPVELSSNTLPVAIAVEGVSGYNIPVQCQYSYAVKLTASSSDYSFSNWLNMEKCTKEHFADFGGIIDDGTQDILNYYYCLPKASNSGSIYGLSLHVSCPSQSGLDDFVSTSPTVELFYPKYGLTLQNYKNPIQPYLFDFEIGLKNKTTYSYWSLSHLNITTDEGWLATSDKTAYYVQVAPQVNPSVYDAGGIGVVFEFVIDKQELFYTRTYTKVQNVLAAVGGIAGSVLGILLILITPYTRIKLSEAFVNEMFQVKLEKQQTVHKGKQRRAKSKKSAKEMKNSHRDSQESFDRDEIKKENLKVIELSKRDSKDTGNTPIAKDKPKPAEFANTVNDESPCKSPLLGCEDERYVSSNLSWKTKNLSKPLVSVSENEKVCLSRPQVGEALVLQVNTNTPNNVKRSDSDIEEGLKSIQTVRQKDLTDQLETQQPFLQNQNDIIIDLKEERNDKAHKGLENLEVDSAHPVAEVAVEGDDEGEEHIRDENDIQAKTQKDGDRDPNEAELEDANTKLSPGGVLGIVQSALPTKPKKIKRPKTIHISFLEYVRSFFFKSEATKEKLAILNKGLDILDSRLDILSILKKLRDVDKIKGLIFDADQQFLFDKLPRPQINNRANHWFKEDYAPQFEILKDSNEVKELGMKAQIRDSKKRIEEKPKKSKVDEKILSLM